jgi:hypothetical protein
LSNTGDDLSFSNSNGSTLPTPDGNGHDNSETNIRINPKGPFAKTGVSSLAFVTPQSDLKT